MCLEPEPDGRKSQALLSAPLRCRPHLSSPEGILLTPGGIHQEHLQGAIHVLLTLGALLPQLTLLPPLLLLVHTSAGHSLSAGTKLNYRILNCVYLSTEGGRNWRSPSIPPKWKQVEELLELPILPCAFTSFHQHSNNYHHYYHNCCHHCYGE